MCICVKLKIQIFVEYLHNPVHYAIRDAVINALYWRKCTGADVNTMERGMLFVVITVVPRIISTTSLSPLNSPRPGSSTRLLISMDVTPRRIPFIGLHLDVSRAEAFPSSPSVARPIHLSGTECSWDIISFSSAKRKILRTSAISACGAPSSLSPLIKEERYIATFIDQVAPHRR